MERIVIVDDEPIARMDIAGMLEELHYEVVGEAADGFDAIELCRAKRPDVVLMDVRMPVFDGLTAAETITREKLARCVILLTAFNDEEIIRRAKRAGVTGYLVKPLEQKLLRPAIEVALAQSERLEESRLEAEKAKKQLSDSRIVAHAQAVLAQRDGISSEEAYARLRKLSMDKRVSIPILAQAILDQAQQKERKS
jgi:response regulator NasT